MDEYYRLAGAYFKQFEPRSAFPRLNTPHWYLWLVTLCGFVFFAYQTFIAEMPSSDKPYWLLFTSEISFLCVCAWIGFYRFGYIVNATSEESDLRPAQRLTIAKRKQLEQLFNKPSWQFTEVVEGITKLRKLEATYRSFTEQSLLELLGKLFNPKVLAALLTLLTSLLTWFINWLSKNEGFSVSELVTDHNQLTLFIALAKLVTVTVFAILATYVLLWQLFSLVPQMISIAIPVLSSNHAVLNYLIRDLIHCQTLPPAAAVEVLPENNETALSS